MNSNFFRRKYSCFWQVKQIKCSQGVSKVSKQPGYLDFASKLFVCLPRRSPFSDSNKKCFMLDKKDQSSFICEENKVYFNDIL